MKNYKLNEMTSEEVNKIFSEHYDKLLHTIDEFNEVCARMESVMALLNKYFELVNLLVNYYKEVIEIYETGKINNLDNRVFDYETAKIQLHNFEELSKGFNKMFNVAEETESNLEYTDEDLINYNNRDDYSN